MNETKFEVGKVYNTRNPQFGPRRVTDINPDDPIWPIQAEELPKPSPRGKSQHMASGAYLDDHYESTHDLLLPAIEAEGEPAPGMHPKVRQALEALRELWEAFAGDVHAGLIDPCGNGYFLMSDGARIACGYESREAALTKCRQIIAAVDRMLEGRPHD